MDQDGTVFDSYLLKHNQVIKLYYDDEMYTYGNALWW